MSQSSQQSAKHRTVYDWIGGKPVVSDETNFDWIGGVPRVIYERTTVGWTHIKPLGITAANISKVNGVAVAAISKFSGVAV